MNVKSVLFVLSLTMMTVFSQNAQAIDYVEPRIVGGTESGSSSWPWMVLLSRSTSANDYFCGGSLISEDLVLTAAHCIAPNDGQPLYAFVGMYDRNDTSIMPVSITERLVYPFYDANTTDHDIALVKLATPATGNPVLNIADNAIMSSLLVGDDLTVMGWGATEDPIIGDTPTILREAVVPFVDNNTCNDSMSNQITPNMLCAGYAAGGVDSCQGDSGGPLILNNAGTWYQAGVVSWGVGCADAGNYGVYSRVAVYNAWINQVKDGILINPAVDMGSWISGLTASYQIDISNQNSSAFAVTGFGALTGGYSVAGNTCTTTLNPGDSCSVTVQYVVSTLGSFSDELVISTSHASYPSISVPLKVTAIGQSAVSADGMAAEIIWAKSGAQNWYETNATSNSGASMQSGAITDSQSSSLFAYVNVSGPSRDVFFDWKACSEPSFDYLELWIDNKKVDALSGDAYWRSKQITLNGSGDHVIEWRYKKDYVCGTSQDAGWIDNVALDTKSPNPLPSHIEACNLDDIRPAYLPCTSASPPGTEPSTELVATRSGGAVSVWWGIFSMMAIFMRRRRVALTCRL